MFWLFSAHYLGYIQLCSVWLRGNTLYLSINPFPPAVTRSLTVTSAAAAAHPYAFYSSAVHLAHRCVSPSSRSACLTPYTLYTLLIPPPTTLFTAVATDSDSH